MKRFVLIFLCLLVVSNLICQNNFSDTVSVKQKQPIKSHSPKKATLLSCFLPGAGQIYNKSYWKVPVIYAGLGGFGYMFIKNQQLYSSYRKDLIAEYDGDSTTINTSGYSGDQLQVKKITFRKNRDYALVGLAAIYLINIIDANVDAHLKSFDVSDDLSMKITPRSLLYNSSNGIGFTAGLSIKLTIR